MKINNIVELKTRRGTTGSNVNVLGYYSAGDGGGGEFYWDNSSTETDNGGTIIKVTGLTTGRWKLKYNNIVDVKTFGVKADGTDCTTALQAMFNVIGNDKSVIFSNGNYLFSSVTIKNVNLTVKGDGIIDGTLNIEPDNLQSIKITLQDLTFNHATKKDSIIFKNTSGFTVKGCTFTNSAKCINFNCPNLFHNVNKGVITNNNIYYCDYVVYSEKPLGSDNLIVADVHITNNMIVVAKYTHIKLYGIDGVVVKDNTMFFIGYPAGDLDKKHNIEIDYANWTIISGNNLFEAGEESIYLKRCQNANITNNNIAWCGQKSPSSGIKFDISDNGGQQYCMSIISNNNIMRATKHGIEIDGVCGYINITGNQIFDSGSSDFYYGVVDLTSIPHYGVSSSPTTSYITSSNNLYPSSQSNVLSSNSSINADFSIFGLKIFKTVVSNLTTLDLKNADIINIAQPAATNISSLINGEAGKIVTFLCFNSNTTFIHSTSLRLKGATNVNIPENGMISFMFNAGSYFEVSRNF